MKAVKDSHFENAFVRRGIFCAFLALFSIAASLALAQKKPEYWNDLLENEKTRMAWQRVPDVFEALGAGQGSVIADIGAGNGFFTSRLSSRVGPKGRVFAVEIDDNSIDYLNTRVKIEKLGNVIVVRGKTDDPCLPQGEVDAVLVMESYHDMENQPAMLRNIRKALKTAGRLVIIDKIKLDADQLTRKEQTAFHGISMRYVETDLKEAGFEVVRLEKEFIVRPETGTPFWLIEARSSPLIGKTAR